MTEQSTTGQTELVRSAAEGSIDVVTVGECLVALVAESGRPLAEASTFTRHVAGAEANAAVGLARLGHSTAFVGRIGGDGFGEAVQRRLRGEGVDISHLEVDDRGWTGLLIREVRGIGCSEVWYQRRGSAASTLDVSSVDAAAPLIASARWLHVTGVTPALSTTCRAAVDRAVDLAREHGLSVSLDVNLRTKLWDIDEAAPVLLGLASRSTVALVGLDEGRLITGKEDPDDIASVFSDAGAGSVVVKLGAAGARLYKNGVEPLTRPALSVPHVVDVVGAGDAFAAGFLSGRLDQLSDTECLDLANLCGAFAVSSAGDLDGLPTRAEAYRVLGGGGDVIR